MLSSLLRDEILEISLHPSRQPSESIICELRSKCDEVYSQLPVSLHWKSERLASTSAMDFYWQMFLHLEFLHSKFLLDKLQALCGQRDRQPLLDIARQLLDDILVLWKRRDCLWDYIQCEFDFLVSRPIFTRACIIMCLKWETTLVLTSYHWRISSSIPKYSSGGHCDRMISFS